MWCDCSDCSDCRHSVTGGDALNLRSPPLLPVSLSPPLPVSPSPCLPVSPSLPCLSVVSAGTKLYTNIGLYILSSSLNRYKAVRPGGLVAFTVEAFRAWEGDEQDYKLENTGRFVHAPEYVERLAGEVGYVSHSVFSLCLFEYFGEKNSQIHTSS